MILQAGRPRLSFAGEAAFPSLRRINTLRDTLNSS